MKKCPIVVAVVAVLLMLAGAARVLGGVLNASSLSADHYQIVWMVGVNLIAIVAGIFILRGDNWARWLAMAWMAFHVAISFYNNINQVLMHSIILALFAWCLFRGEARAYFANRPLST